MTKQVVLTFDNGPTPGVTEQVLEVLDKHGALATFFVVGQRLDAQGQRLADLCVQQGHWIGNHGYTHGDPLGRSTDPDAAEAEIGRTERLIGSRAHPARLFRPWGTGGALDDRCLSADALRYLADHRYTCVLWNSVPGDWNHPDDWVATALDDVARQPEHEPVVMVLHDIDTGAMNHLDEFLTALHEGGTETVQPFPSSCIPLERGGLTDSAPILDQLVAGINIS